MNRCMISLSATGPLGAWFQSLPDRLPGNQMDGINTLLPVIPPADVLAQLDAADVVTLPTEPVYSTEPDTDSNPVIDTAATLLHFIGIVGVTLSQQPNNSVLIGSAQQWRQLHATPHWRAWTGNYGPEGGELRAADHAAIGLPEGTTDVDARDAIVAQFLEAS